MTLEKQGKDITGRLVLRSATPIPEIKESTYKTLTQAMERATYIALEYRASVNVILELTEDGRLVKSYSVGQVRGNKFLHNGSPIKRNGAEPTPKTTP